MNHRFWLGALSLLLAAGVGVGCASTTQRLAKLERRGGTLAAARAAVSAGAPSSCPVLLDWLQTPRRRYPANAARQRGFELAARHCGGPGRRLAARLLADTRQPLVVRLMVGRIYRRALIAHAPRDSGEVTQAVCGGLTLLGRRPKPKRLRRRGLTDWSALGSQRSLLRGHLLMVASALPLEPALPCPKVLRLAMTSSFTLKGTRAERLGFLGRFLVALVRWRIARPEELKVLGLAPSRWRGDRIDDPSSARLVTGLGYACRLALPRLQALYPTWRLAARFRARAGFVRARRAWVARVAHRLLRLPLGRPAPATQAALLALAKRTPLDCLLPLMAVARNVPKSQLAVLLRPLRTQPWFSLAQRLASVVDHGILRQGKLRYRVRLPNKALRLARALLKPFRIAGAAPSAAHVTRARSLLAYARWYFANRMMRLNQIAILKGLRVAKGLLPRLAAAVFKSCVATARLPKGLPGGRGRQLACKRIQAGARDVAKARPGVVDPAVKALLPAPPPEPDKPARTMSIDPAVRRPEIPVRGRRGGRYIRRIIRRRR